MREDRVFLATLTAAEGYVQSAKVRSGGKLRLNQPRLSIPMHDKAYPARAAKLIRTKVSTARVPTRHHDALVTRWAAVACGVRAALVMLVIWDEILEGVRKRRFRDWMFRVAIPHVEHVSIGQIRHVSRIQLALGVDLKEFVLELGKWKRKNRKLPTEPWKESERKGIS